MPISYPVPITADKYTALITSEYQESPKFLAMVAAIVQAFVDNQNLVNALPALFDLDYAVGVQLDRVGERIGRSRYLETPLPNVYFSWGVEGLGWGQGVWYKREFSATSGLVRLDDSSYRTLLYAVVAANQWDGTIPGAYTAWNTVFAPLGYRILIQDYGDMSMVVALLGDTAPDAVTISLFANGYLSLKPAGVRIASYVTQSVIGAPLFGWGVENENIAGWGTGAWAKVALDRDRLLYLLDDEGAPLLDDEGIPFTAD